MSLSRFRNSSVWWYEFRFAGQRIRETTRTRSKKLAGEAERKRRAQLEASYNGVKQRRETRLFSAAAKEYLDLKRLTFQPATLTIATRALRYLLAEFGRLLVSDISAGDVARYQQRRQAEGASPRTVDIEVGTLRAVLRRQGVWAEIQRDVRMLPPGPEVGRALSREEETRLLAECLNSRARNLYPIVVMALSTGLRKSEIRFLRWQQVDLAAKTVRVGDSKTAAGRGRVLPLNNRARAVMELWATQFPEHQPEHFVFPYEKYGEHGRAYDSDPTRAIGTWKEGWEHAKRRAGVVIRFHDLRHTACTRMLEAGVTYPIVASIMGWSATMAIKMAKRYGHIGQKAYKDAVRHLEGARLCPESPEKSPEWAQLRAGQPN